MEEYISSLPPSIISGDEVQLADNSIRDILKLAGLARDEMFYHLGCGDGSALAIAEAEFGAAAVGIDTNPQKISAANSLISEKKLAGSKALCEDIVGADISAADVVLFWFSDVKVVESMFEKFSKLKEGARVVTVFDPLPGVLPTKVSFPYLLHKTPFKMAKNLKEQLIAIFDTECMDFTTAWEHAERYTKAVGSPNPENDRFLTILQTVTIWINANKLGLSCTKEMPAPIKAYVDILHNFFNIEVKHLL